MTSVASVIIWGKTPKQMIEAAKVAHSLVESGEVIEVCAAGGDSVLDFPSFSDCAKLLPYIKDDSYCEGIEPGSTFTYSLEEYLADPDDNEGNNIVWVSEVNGEKVWFSVMLY